LQQIARRSMFLTLFVWLLTALSEEKCVAPRLDKVTIPEHPVATVEGGVVLLDLLVDEEGRVSKLRTLEGRNPFSQKASDAVRRWTFAPAQIEKPVESRVGVVMMFRPRMILEFGPPQRKMRQLSSSNRPALPVTIFSLPYPANSVAEGVVVLQLEIDIQGGIAKIDVIEGVSPLTAVARKSVETWRFAPAKVDGQPVCGMVIVAVSFLRPAL
jgi:TonB family protein